MICVGCGCSEDDACADGLDEDGEVIPCHWVLGEDEDGGPLCSVCIEEETDGDE